MTAAAQVTPVSQMEKLDRGVVVLPAKSTGMFVSWRLLGTDDEAVVFDVLRDGEVIASDLHDATCYNDTKGKTTSTYQIVAKVNGETVETSNTVTPWAEPVMQVPLMRPAAGSDYDYSPSDCSVGDVDGDGQYEIFLKWDPSNAKDNSQEGVTGNVYLDCYRLDGTRLWRVDLGPNIRAGAHYTQFMVYDFDGDGRAEMMCKTAPGSKDGQGHYVNQAATQTDITSASNTTTYRNSNGRITGGQEYLTVFNGLTGAAIHTIFYNPNRDTGYGGAASGTFNWDDRSGKNDKASYGNRGERYLAAVAHLQGPDANPSGIFCRGYYTYAFVWAVDFDGQQLKQRWFHASKSKTSYTVTNANQTTRTYTPPASTSGGGSRTMYGNGTHNMSVADVDGDGRDEIIWGSAALDDDGKLLYATGFGHGDAIHMADHNPDNPGLEVFEVHEEKGTYSWDLHDAATGKILLKGGNSGVDNGRGLAGQFDVAHRGSYFCSSDERSLRSAVTGDIASTKNTSVNCRIFWDGDLQEELLDGTGLSKWTANGVSNLSIKGKSLNDYYNSEKCNGTKSTPNLQADILGDWREEVILWNASTSASLNIFTTNEPTTYRVPTLMHDHTYRMGVAWQNTAYNQPPHLGYYLPDRFAPVLTFVDESPQEQTITLGEEIQPVILQYNEYTSSLAVDSTYTPTQQRRGLYAAEFSRTALPSQKRIEVHGTPTEVGDYRLVFKANSKIGNCVGPRYVSALIHVEAGADGIVTHPADNTPITAIYTPTGTKLPTTDIDALPTGVYLITRGGQTRKIVK